MRGPRQDVGPKGPTAAPNRRSKTYHTLKTASYVIQNSEKRGYHKSYAIRLAPVLKPCQNNRFSTLGRMWFSIFSKSGTQWHTHDIGRVDAHILVVEIQRTAGQHPIKNRIHITRHGIHITHQDTMVQLPQELFHQRALTT